MYKLIQSYYEFKLARVKKALSKNAERIRLSYENVNPSIDLQLHNEQLRLMSYKSNLQSKLFWGLSTI